MSVTKESILIYLAGFKKELEAEGITELALFGSYATASQTPYSDIDIAIRKAPDYLQERSAYDYFDLLERIKNKIAKHFHKNADIFDLDSQSPLKASIEKELVYV